MVFSFLKSADLSLNALISHIIIFQIFLWNELKLLMSKRTVRAKFSERFDSSTMDLPTSPCENVLSTHTGIDLLR